MVTYDFSERIQPEPCCKEVSILSESQTNQPTKGLQAISQPWIDTKRRTRLRLSLGLRPKLVFKLRVGESSRELRQAGPLVGPLTRRGPGPGLTTGSTNDRLAWGLFR